MSTPAAPAPAISVPLYVAQTSPLSPFSPASGPGADDQAFLFPSLQWNLAQYARQFELASQTEDLAQGGVVVFPEYGLNGIIPDHSAYALPSPYLLEALQALCKRFKLAAVTTIVEPFVEPSHPPLLPPNPFIFSEPFEGTLVPSSSIDLRQAWAEYEDEMEKVGYESVNVAYYVSAEGEVVGRYEKANLWHPERDYLKSGSEPSEVFDTPWGKAGLVICWDLSHPEAVQSLARRGAEIIFAPTYWLSTDSDPIQRKYTPIAPLYDHVLLPSLAFIRAFESESLLIMGNPGVASPPTPLSSSPSPFEQLIRQGEEIAFGENTYEKGFFGQSGVWAPLAGKVGDCGEQEGAWSGKVSMEVIKDARTTYKIVEEAHMRAKAKK